jgi:sugar phosphate isomerase/epimerase
MKLALSNLAIPADVGDEVYRSLREIGVEGIEVAPTRIAPWEDLSPARLADFRNALAGNGFAISSLQAILFGVPDVALLEDEARFRSLADHMERVADIAADLGGSVAVFGSPRQRARGELSKPEAFELGRERFGILASKMYAKGVVIGLEPVPAAYGGTFLETWQEADEMVRAVDHPGLRLHLDTGCVLLGGGDIAQAVMECTDVLSHFHIAEPKLASFDDPAAEHDAAAKALRAAKYRGWVAIEMLEVKNHPVDAVMNAARFACARYLAV